MSVARGAPNAGHFYSNIVSPIKVDCQFVVNSTDSGGLGITSLKSNGYIQNVYMNTSATPASGSPNPIAGYAMVHFKQNFNKYLGMDMSVQPPVTGSAINIADSSVLTLGTPYQIVTVGAVPAPHFDIVTVADSAGSLASKYFTLSDVFGNNYVVYFIVNGVGSAPSLTGGLTGYQAVPVSLATNAANTTVATAIGVALNALNSTGSFSTSVGGHTVTVTSAAANHDLQFTNTPQVQTSGFSIGAITFTHLQKDWNNVGLPAGFTPAVGAAFVATATGSALGTGTVKAVGVSGLVSAEVVGNSDQMISNQSIAVNQGAWVIVKFLGATNSSTTTLIATAPAAGTVLNLSFEFDQSSVSVDGL